MLDAITRLWTDLVGRIAADLVSPALAWLPLGHLAGDPHDIAAALLIALLQLVIIACIFRPLEAIAPAEKWTDRRFVGVDRNLTLLMIFGLNPLFAFLVLTPVAALLTGGGAATLSDFSGHFCGQGSAG